MSLMVLGKRTHKMSYHFIESLSHTNPEGTLTINFYSPETRVEDSRVKVFRPMGES